jgi:hypothetical protein
MEKVPTKKEMRTDMLKKKFPGVRTDEDVGTTGSTYVGAHILASPVATMPGVELMDLVMHAGHGDARRDTGGKKAFNPGL